MTKENQKKMADAIERGSRLVTGQNFSGGLLDERLDGKIYACVIGCALIGSDKKYLDNKLIRNLGYSKFKNEFGIQDRDIGASSFYKLNDDNAWTFEDFIRELRDPNSVRFDNV